MEIKDFSQMNNDLIELVRFQHVWQAHIFSAILEEEDIESFVTESNALEPAMGFVVYVNQAKKLQAEQLLKAFDKSNSELPENFDQE